MALKQCCFCCNLENGAVIVGLLHCILSIMFFCFITTMETDSDVYDISWILFLGIGLHILAGISLIAGGLLVSINS